jgi:hypothetical protein
MPDSAERNAPRRAVPRLQQLDLMDLYFEGTVWSPFAGARQERPLPRLLRTVPTGNNRFIDTSRLLQPNSGHDWTPS